MTSFHPTIAPQKFIAYLFSSLQKHDAEECFEVLFPEHHVYLTDSGRSAFALAIDSLGLRGKTMLLPAYVCDALFPVLQHYEIQPVFLDVDNETYQPPLSAYTDELLANVDAVLLVATYGKEPQREVVQLLRKKNKIIIEDYAGRNPLLRDELLCDARIYSFPKTLPVPDGGLAVVPKRSADVVVDPHRFSLGFVKNVVKLLPLVAPFIAHVRKKFQEQQSAPTWDGIRTPSNLTTAILSDICREQKSAAAHGTYTYCYPMLVANPREVEQKLSKLGVCGERVWQSPIVLHKEVQSKYGLKTEDYPVTKRIALEIICAPLWHIQSEEAYRNYVERLEKTLADDGR